MARVSINNYRQRAGLAVSVIFGVLVFLAIFLRIIARRVVHRRLDASDYCAIVAAVTAGALMGMTIAVLFSGLAYGTAAELVADYGPETIMDLYKLLLPHQLLWTITLSFSKISVLLLYIDLFSTRMMVLMAKGMLVFITLWLVGMVTAGNLICLPFELNWMMVPGHECGNREAFFLTSGSVSLITDIIVVTMPLPTIAKLQMQKYKKIVLLAIFSLGSVTCVFSAIRLVFLAHLDFTDTSNGLYLMSILSALEGALASILCCMPMLRPLFGKERRAAYGATGYALEEPSTHSWKKQATGLGSGSQVDLAAVRVHSMSPKCETEISSSPMTRRDMATSETGLVDQVDRVKKDDDPRGIVVKQEWRVTSYTGQ